MAGAAVEGGASAQLTLLGCAASMMARELMPVACKHAPAGQWIVFTRFFC